MKQAEKLLDDVGWSKALLEIQYEHEVHADVMFCSAVSYKFTKYQKITLFHPLNLLIIFTSF